MQRIPKYTAGMFKKKMPRFGGSAIKMPRMPKPPKPRVKKLAEGGEIDPMDDLPPFQNLPSNEDEPEKYRPHSPSTRGGRRRPPLKQEDEVVVTTESYRKSLSPEARKRYDKEQMELKQRQERNRREDFDNRAIDPDTFMKKFGRKGRVTTAKSGGTMKSYASGGSVSSASKRADGCAVKGKTKGRFV